MWGCGIEGRSFEDLAKHEQGCKLRNCCPIKASYSPHFGPVLRPLFFPLAVSLSLSLSLSSSVSVGARKCVYDATKLNEGRSRTGARPALFAVTAQRLCVLRCRWHCPHPQSQQGLAPPSVSLSLCLPVALCDSPSVCLSLHG